MKHRTAVGVCLTLVLAACAHPDSMKTISKEQEALLAQFKTGLSSVQGDVQCPRGRCPRGRSILNKLVSCASGGRRAGLQKGPARAARRRRAPGGMWGQDEKGSAV